MGNHKEIMAIVEGKTEVEFIKRILAPYLLQKNIRLRPTQVSKKGQNGGDVTYKRVFNDINKHLKQRKDTMVTTFIDLYGLKMAKNRRNF